MAAQKIHYWEISQSHTFYFNSDGPITALSLADNLRGLDGISKASTKVIGKILNVDISGSQLLIEQVSLESYKDSFIFRLVFGKGRKGEQKLEKFREALKLSDMNPRTLAQFSLAGAVVWGGWHVANAYKQEEGNAEAHYHFENSFNTIALQADIEPEAAKEIFEQAVKNQEQLKKDVVRLTRPGGHLLQGAITFDDNPSLSLPAEAIAAIPPKYEAPDRHDPEKHFKDIQIIVRALDLDTSSRGWWAIVPEVSESRIPMEIDDEVNPATLPAGKLFHAEITITYKADRHGEKKASKVYLHNKLKK